MRAMAPLSSLCILVCSWRGSVAWNTHYEAAEAETPSVHLNKIIVSRRS